MQKFELVKSENKSGGNPAVWASHHPVYTLNRIFVMLLFKRSNIYVEVYTVL